jgi:hypothetical protein
MDGENSSSYFPVPAIAPPSNSDQSLNRSYDKSE